MSASESETFSLTINGEAQEARPGERVLAVAQRAGVEIPTLCEDSRLDPAGCCRMCLVEVSGQRRLQPACTWRAEPGQSVVTESERIARHRKVLLQMYLADAPPAATTTPLTPQNELTRLAARHVPEDAVSFPASCSAREGREDPNPYVGFDPTLCISCARCVRYCDEVEAVSAITLAGRGAETTIATASQVGLLDSTCELCGGCIDTCPTGAKKPALQTTVTEEPLEQVRTTCNFCGVGCQLDLQVQGDRIVRVDSPPAGETVNDGNLCVKGRFVYDFVHHEDRLTTPLVRGEDGALREASWEEALQRAAEGLLGVKERHGADALGFISSSRCTGEENYLVQKLARAAFGTNNCHQCAAT